MRDISIPGESKTLAINDIEIPIRLEARSRRELLAILRGAHHFRDAFEITLKGTNFKYYVCAMDQFNELGRKRVLSRAAQMVKDCSPEEMMERIRGDARIIESIFWGRVG